MKLNNRGNATLDGGRSFVIGFVILVMVLILTAVIASQLLLSTSAATSTTVADQARNTAANVTVNLGNIGLTSFTAKNSTNASNTIGAGNYTVNLALGTYALLTPQYASQPINITFAYADQLRTAAYNATQQGIDGVTNMSSLVSLIGTIGIATIVIGLVIGGLAMATKRD